jgi:hypothetical protein
VLDVLTVELDSALPFALHLGVRRVDGAARVGGLRGRLVPCRWEELDVDVRQERKRGDLAGESQVGGMVHQFDDGQIEIVRGREDVG